MIESINNFDGVSIIHLTYIRPMGMPRNWTNCEHPIAGGWTAWDSRFSITPAVDSTPDSQIRDLSGLFDGGIFGNANSDIPPYLG